ncbi:MAG: hypothetical protein QM503_12755 [Bacteroidota bacterium]
MIKISNYHYLFPYKIGMIILIMLFFMVPNSIYAKKKKKKKPQDFEIKFVLASTYDNNILKYSDKYLTRFMNGEDEGRFHIKTYDDLIITTSLKMSYTFQIFDKLKSKVNGEISRRSYIVNDIKSWDYFAIGFQQYFTKHASLKFSYSYIPYFYVRHFRDRQWVTEYGFTPETFKPYVFSKDYFGLTLQNTYLKNTRITLSLHYARYYHNKYFTPFDSKDLIYGIKLYQPLHRKFRLKASYHFVTSDAKGYNSAIETPETSLGPDATFVEDRFSLGFIWYLPRIDNRSNHFDVNFGLLLRYYSSEYPPLVDPLHTGRVDHNYRVYAAYKISLSKAFRLSAYYRLYLRDSDTKALINKWYVSNEKDYSQYHIGVELTYKIKY